MKHTPIIARLALVQMGRSRPLFVYAGALFAIVAMLAVFGGDPAKVSLTLASLLLLIVPLVTLILIALQQYNNREFVELLLAQPISRRAVYWGLWLGMSLALLGGCTLPILIGYLVWGNFDATILLGATCVLTLCFSALAYRIAVGQPDKARGIGLALMVWLYCAVLYDAVLVVAIVLLEDYPLEKMLLVLLALNPIDAVRVALLLHSDASALMGITGAVLREFFGTERSILIITLIIAGWVGYPLFRGMQIFSKRDF
jgi:Cu-processing system permease protein